MRVNKNDKRQKHREKIPVLLSFTARPEASATRIPIFSFPADSTAHIPGRSGSLESTTDFPILESQAVVYLSLSGDNREPAYFKIDSFK